ncbi:zinc finger CCCH domain-containing protein 20 [Punica granatum]|uniref:C3H1-type domain-containing protein n=2 Tax=Punica granatum TaxID=22663 RepID=A0A218W0B0_PUNGR|nr:zinc finger CCCH domain-containing protein 20 [Punica granatum]OWM66096.1 hypothetical protein CDL15_Pgr015523 [Punica granatum]PKI49089.1 hypothetical protein CRG98_030541 [Punica granatum]
MMIGHPTVEVPPWPLLEDPTDDVYSPFSPQRSDGGNGTGGGGDLVSALRRFLPSNRPDLLDDDEEGGGGQEAADSPVDTYSCDHFRMYEFKVRRCTRGRSHDWTECPYAHPGEKARRRDPRKYHYSGAACPEFRKGSCRKGEACEYAHGVFECWLHPARYRTQPCKDGVNCRRRVCFFAHTPEQLRVITQQSPRGGGGSSGSDFYEVSPLKQAIEASCARSLPFLASPSSISPDDSDSPPLSPMTQSLSRSLGSSSVSDVVASLRNLQLGKVKSLPSSWNSPLGGPNYASSPRGSMLRSSCFSVPTTPTQTPNSPGFGYLDLWEKNRFSEEPVMERVESGRNLRARMFERLSKENPLEPGQAKTDESGGAPDVGWVSELVM